MMGLDSGAATLLYPVSDQPLGNLRYAGLTNEKSLEEALAEAFDKADALEAPLDERLKFYLGESRRLLPDVESTYDDLVARIQANGAEIVVPAIGERLPDFLMTDSEGHLVDLASLLRRGPLVISFNRGPWCDYCGLELHALARAYPKIVAAGGEVISIVPETAKYARALQQSRGLPFRVLTDLDLQRLLIGHDELAETIPHLIEDVGGHDTIAQQFLAPLCPDGCHLFASSN